MQKDTQINCIIFQYEIYHCTGNLSLEMDPLVLSITYFNFGGHISSRSILNLFSSASLR